MSADSKRRQILGLSSLVLGCWLLAVPAQAGLGDLIDGAVEEVAELPVVTSIPAPTVTIPEVVPPVVVDLPTVSTPEVVLPIGDGVVIDPIVITPPPVEVEPDGTIAVDPEHPPVVIGGDVLPSIEVPIVTTTSQPSSRPTVLNPPPIDERPVAVDPPADRSVELRIFQTIVATQVLAGAEPAPLASTTSPTSTSWLESLAEWLGIESLSQLLAIPFRLLSLLFRALMSAGSGLVAPASILVAATVGARRRFILTAI